MATVQLAYDLKSRRDVAIKRLLRNDTDSKESFNREWRALSALSPHPNIVELLDVGKDLNGQYMVLEWIPETLATFRPGSGRMQWADFFLQIGRPLLNALDHAQQRKWSHRDLKPENILMAADGIPKLADFGIAKNMAVPSIGATFKSFRSVPFTPPEDDDIPGDRLARDCFSWAAVATYCLTAHRPSDYGELNTLLEGLDHEAIPVNLLRGAISASPSERPQSASVLLADLDAAEAKRAVSHISTEIYYLSISDRAIDLLIRLSGYSDKTDVEQALARELNDVRVGLRSHEYPNGRKGLRVFCVEYMLELAHERSDSARLVVVGAFRLRASDIERSRENSYCPQINFQFHIPRHPVDASTKIEKLLLDVALFEAGERDRQAEAQKERIFKLWHSFLRAKGDFEERRQNAIAFVASRLIGNRIALTTELPTSSDIGEGSRVIRLPGGAHFFCDIVDINLDEVVVAATYGDLKAIPQRGYLEVNTIAAERAISRQRSSLNAVNYDRSASRRLKPLVIDPRTALPPTPMETPKIDGGPFDEEKTAILRLALGVQDILAIEGPPGTGKTRLIEEIVVQYLRINPSHRVLVSSQTHVALDNVVSRVRLRQPDIEVVRIGKLDDQKIAKSNRELLIEHKALQWSEGVRKRASSYLAAWATQHGIDHSSIEIGMLVERLAALLSEERILREELRKAASIVRSASEEAERKASQTGSALSPAIESQAVEADAEVASTQRALAPLRTKMEEVCARLRNLGPYGPELASLRDEEELRVWSNELLGKSEAERQCRALLELQEKWLQRVGRSSDFHAAMLSSAQVVAGTCIGMAGVPGMAQVTYDLCIVDEASKATATEVLVPMSRSRKWILVGDPMQLPPFFEDQEILQIEGFSEEEVRETLFDRFLKDLPEHSRAKLKTQHRMASAIGGLISWAFYDDKLKSALAKPKFVLTGSFPKAVTWLSTSDSKGAAERGHRGSYRNDLECEIIRSTLARIDFIARNRKATYEVGVISGYVAQVKALQDTIREHLHNWANIKIICSTVDAFQGSEVEFCIYSVTRSNQYHQLGFLREKPRLNVALSRARSGLIIVGDDEFCREAGGANPFKKVLDFIDTNSEICERRPAQ